MTLDEELTAVENVVQAGLDAAKEHLARMTDVAHPNKATIAHYNDYLDTTTSVASSILVICRRLVSTGVSSDTTSTDELTRAIESLIAGVLESLRAMYLAMNVIEQIAAPTGGHDSPSFVLKPQKESRETRSCSFCSRPDTETNLVAGPAGNICASCTRLACAVLGIALQETGEE